MKFIFLYFALAMLLQCEIYSHDVSAESKYKKQGIDWPGLCNTGKLQSPINIIDGGNTILDPSRVTFNYKMNLDALEKKFFFDGDRLYMNINLGDIKYFNHAGAEEVYRMKRIELHMPSEHYITMDRQTPRYPLEMQIIHEMIKTTNARITNAVIPIKQAIVSVLFTVGDKEIGSVFLEQMGISKTNIDPKNNEYLTPKPNSSLGREVTLRASYVHGFNIIAFQGLLNDINADQHMYFYYGSETIPPCNENVQWMVFAQPRSISRTQLEFLILLLVKNKKQGRHVRDTTNPNELYGNKRSLIIFDQTIRKKVLSNPRGLMHVKMGNFFKDK